MRKEDIKAREFGKVISIDIDVMPCESVQGYNYRLDAIDHGSSWLWTFGLKNRRECEKHITYLINSLKSHIRQIRVDGAKEFLTNNIKDLCYEYGIELKRRESYEHAQAGKVGKQHDIIDSMVRTWLTEASLPKTIWFKASVAALLVRNRSTNSCLKVKTTPYEKRYGTKPRVDNLKVYGCLCFAHVSKEKRYKLDDTAIRSNFVGYSTQSPVYEL